MKRLIPGLIAGVIVFIGVQPMHQSLTICRLSTEAGLEVVMKMQQMDALVEQMMRRQREFNEVEVNQSAQQLQEAVQEFIISAEACGVIEIQQPKVPVYQEV